MTHRIIRDFDRPDPELLARLRTSVNTLALTSPTAFGGGYVVDGAIKPVREDMKVFGPAFTVMVDEPDILLPSYATTLAQPGDVMVIDVGGRTDIAVWGNSMALSAMNRQLGGVVVDGAVNDVLLLRGKTEYTASEEQRRGAILPVFARAAAPAFGGWNKPGSINVPVHLGARVVAAGDLVVGDADGVVVIPKALIGEVEQRTSKLAAMARALTWHPRIKAGEMWFDILSMQDQIASLQIPETER